MQHKHITIVTSPTGEEWYEAYGPLTKDRFKATEFFTNDLTLRAPQRFGRWDTAFWESEKKSEALSRKKYEGWTHRHVPITAD